MNVDERWAISCGGFKRKAGRSSTRTMRVRARFALSRTGSRNRQMGVDFSFRGEANSRRAATISVEKIDNTVLAASSH